MDIHIKRTDKGLSAFAMHPMPAGSFVCEYAGECLTAAEATRRLGEYDCAGIGHALLVARETLPSGEAHMRLNVDATRSGNVARFFSHSCDGGNLHMVMVRKTGVLLPHVAMIASVDILPGDELTFAYGLPSARPSGRPCFCQTAACLGFLPRSPT